MSSVHPTLANSGPDLFYQLPPDFVEAVANAYATGESFDDMCLRLEYGNNYSVPDTTVVWTVLRNHEGVRAEQMSRLTSFATASPAHYLYFNDLVRSQIPQVISGVLVTQKVDNRTMLIHPEVVRLFVTTRLESIHGDPPEKNLQHWLVTDGSFYSTFCQSLLTCISCTEVDRRLGFPKATTYRLLQLNPAPRLVFCDSNPNQPEAKRLIRFTDFETEVQAGVSHEDLVDSKEWDTKSLSNNWKYLHPVFKFRHIGTYYADSMRQREHSR